MLWLLSTVFADPGAYNASLDDCVDGDVVACEKVGHWLVRRMHQANERVWDTTFGAVRSAACDAGDIDACVQAMDYESACALDPEACGPPVEGPIGRALLGKTLRNARLVGTDHGFLRWEEGRLFDDRPLIAGADAAVAHGPGFILWDRTSRAPQFAKVQPDGTEIVSVQVPDGRTFDGFITFGEHDALALLDGRVEALVDLDDGRVEPLEGQGHQLAGDHLLRKTLRELFLRNLATSNAREIPLPPTRYGTVRLAADGTVWSPDFPHAMVWSGEAWEAMPVTLEGGFERDGSWSTLERGKGAPGLLAYTRAGGGTVDRYWVRRTPEGTVREIRRLEGVDGRGTLRFAGDQLAVGDGESTTLFAEETTPRALPAWATRETHAGQLVHRTPPDLPLWTVVDGANQPLPGVRLAALESDAEGRIPWNGRWSTACAWVDERCHSVTTDTRKRTLTVGPPPIELQLPDGARLIGAYGEDGASLRYWTTTLTTGKSRVRTTQPLQRLLARKGDRFWTWDGEWTPLAMEEIIITDPDGRRLSGVRTRSRGPFGEFSVQSDLLGRVLVAEQGAVVAPRGTRDGQDFIVEVASSDLSFGPVGPDVDELYGRWSVDGEPALLTPGEFDAPMFGGRSNQVSWRLDVVGENELVYGPLRYRDPVERLGPDDGWRPAFDWPASRASLVSEGRPIPLAPTTHLSVGPTRQGYTAIDSGTTGWFVQGQPALGAGFWRDSIGYLQSLVLVEGETINEDLQVDLDEVGFETTLLGTRPCAGESCRDVRMVWKKGGFSWDCRWLVEEDTLRPHEVRCAHSRTPDDVRRLRFFWHDLASGKGRLPNGPYETHLVRQVDNSCGTWGDSWSPKPVEVFWPDRKMVVFEGVTSCGLKGRRLEGCSVAHLDVPLEDVPRASVLGYAMSTEGRVKDGGFTLTETTEIRCARGGCPEARHLGIDLPCQVTVETRVVPADR